MKSFKPMLKKYVLDWLCPVAVVFIIIIATSLMAVPLQLLAEECESGFLSTFLEYLSSVFLLIVSFLFIYFTKKNRPIISAMGKKASGNRVSFALWEALAGFALVGVCVLLAVMNGDITLTFTRFEFFPLLILLITVFLQATGEEVLVHGYLFQRLKKAYKNPAVAIIMGGVVFSLPHMLNSGSTVLSFFQIFLGAVIMAEMVYYFDSFWMPCTFHTMWNFSQNIIFGLPNSGRVTSYSLFALDTATAKDSLFYNVGFGLESSASSCILLLIGCIAIYLWGKKHNSKPIDVWGEEETKNDEKEN